LTNFSKNGKNRDRLTAVERVRESWIRRLIDLSRRNNLLYYRELKTGTLDLSDANKKALDELLAGKTVLLTRLLPHAEETKAVAQVQKIRRRAITNLEEKGLETLFLALGMATWTPTDAGRPPEAAILLVPIAVEVRGAIKLQRKGEAQINPVLLHVLETEYGCRITVERLLGDAENIAEDEIPDLPAIYTRLTKATQEVKGFEIKSRAVLSNFSFQKMAMVRDLRERLTEMADNDIIAAIAGDNTARQNVRGTGENIDPRELDRISPDNEFLVFDADSSQQRVINAVLDSRSGVIQGPPGTGKSQTISNLIATLAAAGKRVLFVAEKRAALEVVMRRLEQKGLGHLLLDLHGADISRREVMQQVAESLTLVRNAPPIKTGDIHQRFVDRRKRLNEHVQRLHDKRPPSSKSVYEIQAELLQFKDEEQITTRFRGTELNRLTAKKADKVEKLLAEVSTGELASLFLHEHPSPWLKVKLSSGNAALQASDIVQRIATEHLPAVSESLAVLISTTKFTPPTTFDKVKELIATSTDVEKSLSLYSEDIFHQDLQRYVEILSPLSDESLATAWSRLSELIDISKLEPSAAAKKASELIAVMGDIENTLSIYSDGIFRQELEKLARNLSPAKQGFFATVFAGFLDDNYRSSVQILRQLRRNGSVSDERLLSEANQAAQQLRRWRSLLPNQFTPCRIPSFAKVRDRLARLFANPDFCRAICSLRQLRRTKPNNDRQILQEITKAAEQLQRWRTHSRHASVPCRVANLSEVQTHLNSLLADLASIEPNLQRGNLTQLPLKDLEELFNNLAADLNTPLLVARLLEIEREIEQCAAKVIINDIRRLKPAPYLWARQFKYAWLASCLDQARAQDSALTVFHRKTHEQLIGEFCELDQERLKLSSHRVRRAQAERAIAVMNAEPSQEALVRREAAKKTRHLPLRKLLAEAPDVLTALRPCWMASPLSVSQLLDADRRYFDVVIFDEASQVLPEDAVPALLRAERAVVAGDRHQLPPTTFFAVGSDEDDEAEALSVAEGFESLLDLMSSFLEPWSLDWHYRSQDEALIAFSNRHIYGDRLVTFPSAGGSASISHVLVPYVSGQDGQEESAPREVEQVVKLVLQQATQRPSETLGVITMGVKHAQRLEAAIDAALKERPDLAAFFDDSRTERFFVKNIERVQGDERDAIILSVGYGKDRSGKLPYRFGPLLTEGGERRLNVAITRARQRMTLVSSFEHRDMDPNRSQARGVELLRLYLQYAASQGKILGETGHSSVPLNPFEADIYDTLTAKGIPLLPQWGVSRYRIDLVAQHPQKSERFVLAIECDGASYHSAPTARDRDRLRQQQLEALGWRFHRIWSIDWFIRREEEIKRAVAAFQAAVEHADHIDTQKDKPVHSAPKQNKVTQSERLEQPEPETSPSNQRGQRPNVPQRSKIGDYTQAELVALIRWILSDGCLQTDDQICAEMVQELGFKRRGVRIEEAVRAALKKVRSRQ
jgi:very-short-patch-repair endonuclease